LVIELHLSFLPAKSLAMQSASEAHAEERLVHS